MIRIKAGVKFAHSSFVQSEIMRIIWIAQLTAPDGHEVTITCGTEDHDPHTSHAKGKAFDFRTRDFPKGKSVEKWAKRMRAKLGDCYFVMVEPNEKRPDTHPHVHVQYNG